jgi:hypothetical protein
MLSLLFLSSLFLVDFIEIFEIELNSKIIYFFVFWFVFSLSPIIIKIIILANTTYSFFDNHLLREFKLFKIKRHSLPYLQITNISVKVSLWDRFCKAGNIILYTAEDVGPNLVLHYIKEPGKIEEKIYELVNKYKSHR